MELQIVATSASSGSFGFAGVYWCTGFCSVGVYAPARGPGREGVRGVDPSLKLDGGNLVCSGGRAVVRAPLPW